MVLGSVFSWRSFMRADTLEQINPAILKIQPRNGS
jgi:hypothetical protein